MTNLIGKKIWLVDDDLPIQRIDADGILGLLDQRRPVDHTAMVMLSLLPSEDWNDAEEIKLLLEELIESGAELMGFVSPNTLASHLEIGLIVPDAIIFDLKYQNYGTVSRDDVVNKLAYVLQAHSLVVQVYTSEDFAEAMRDIESVKKLFPLRLCDPCSKGDVNSQKLIAILKSQLDSSLAAHVGPPVRIEVAKAVEASLIKIGAIPISKALEVVLGDVDGSSDPGEEFVELLAAKLVGALRQDGELKLAIENASRGTGQFASPDELASTLIAQIRRRLVGNHGISSIITQFMDWLGGRKAQVASATGDSPPSHLEEVREFISYRMYDLIKTERVLTGDLVRYKTNDREGLAMVYTAACDLPRFWSKTRGCLSLIEVFPISQAVQMSEVAAAKNLKAPPSSITAPDGLIWLPSVPVGVSHEDCTIFPHFSFHINLPLLGKDREQRLSTPLRYDDVLTSEKVSKFEPLVRISEPYLTGILGKIADVMTRGGVPDLPSSERSRIAAAVQTLKIK